MGVGQKGCKKASPLCVFFMDGLPLGVEMKVPSDVSSFNPGFWQNTPCCQQVCRTYLFGVFIIFMLVLLIVCVLGLGFYHCGCVKAC